MQVRHAPHCTYRIRYHMVFVIKYRKCLITDEIFDFMKTIFLGITERYYLYFDALGSDGDHLHIVVEGAPRYSPSRIMQICKSILAIQTFKQFPELREELWGGEFWTDGGHIDTVGDGKGLEQIKDYVRKQGHNADQMKLHAFN
ncbi:MAG: IS200/IS605 family transposase [Nanoarchaeota archaeon]|nr:IS200/IS605 family transposase [Nanoarchaeota archaeon]